MFTGVKLNADPESEVGVIVSARRLRTRIWVTESRASPGTPCQGRGPGRS